MILLAQAFGRSWTELAIAVVLIAGLVALVLIGSRAMGLGIPPWLVQVFWVVIVVIVIIAAIRFIASM